MAYTWRIQIFSRSKWGIFQNVYPYICTYSYTCVLINSFFESSKVFSHRTDLIYNRDSSDDQNIAKSYSRQIYIISIGPILSLTLSITRYKPTVGIQRLETGALGRSDWNLWQFGTCWGKGSTFHLQGRWMETQIQAKGTLTTLIPGIWEWHPSREHSAGLSAGLSRGRLQVFTGLRLQSSELLNRGSHYPIKQTKPVAAEMAIHKVNVLYLSNFKMRHLVWKHCDKEASTFK